MERGDWLARGRRRALPGGVLLDTLPLATLLLGALLLGTVVGGSACLTGGRPDSVRATEVIDDEDGEPCGGLLVARSTRTFRTQRWCTRAIPPHCGGGDGWDTDFEVSVEGLEEASPALEVLRLVLKDERVCGRELYFAGSGPFHVRAGLDDELPVFTDREVMAIRDRQLGRVALRRCLQDQLRAAEPPPAGNPVLHLCASESRPVPAP